MSSSRGSLEIGEPKLEVHYSIVRLLAHIGVCAGLSALLFLYAYLTMLKWDTVPCFILSAMLGSAALLFLCRLMTGVGQVIMSVDTDGFRDTRTSPAVIPWSAIRSVAIHKDPYSGSTMGLRLEIEPAFRRTCTISLASNLYNWLHWLNFGPETLVETRQLDVRADEIVHAANTFIANGQIRGP